MKTFLVIAGTILLLFNAVGALYGGWSLITDPTGGHLGLLMSYLDQTPFANYLIPGIILFVVNGVASALAVVAILLRLKIYPRWILLQGFVLLGWIGIQIMMIDLIYFLHYVMAFTAVTLIVCGYFLMKFQVSTKR